MCACRLTNRVVTLLRTFDVGSLKLDFLVHLLGDAHDQRKLWHSGHHGRVVELKISQILSDYLSDLRQVAAKKVFNKLVI